MHIKPHARFFPTQEPAVLHGNETVRNLQAETLLQQQPIEHGIVVGEKGWPGTQGRVPPLRLSEAAHAGRSSGVPWNPRKRNVYGWGPEPGPAAGAAGLPTDGRNSRRLYGSLTENLTSNGSSSLRLAGPAGPRLDSASISRGSGMATVEVPTVGRKQGTVRISRSLSPGHQAAAATAAATATAAASNRRAGRGSHAAALASIYLDRLSDGLPKQFRSLRNGTSREQQPPNRPKEHLKDLPKETFQGSGGSSSGAGGGRSGPPAGQHEFMDHRSTQDRRFGPGSPR
jgi:hypothetical protein